MYPLSEVELLEVWERGREVPVSRRGLRLLTASCPERDADEIARLSIGQRDARLLVLRRRLFGEQLVCLGTCPSCRERLESTVEAGHLMPANELEDVPFLDVVADGYEIRARLPNTLDLLALDLAGGAPGGQQLLERCLVSVRKAESEVLIAELPTSVLQAVEQRMAEMDPLADLQVELSCPACGHRWEEVFDIGAFLWAEIDGWAQGVLREVHVLASSYGWTEEESLRVGPRRRRQYLELVGS
jgi:hypothetical protein